MQKTGGKVLLVAVSLIVFHEFLLKPHNLEEIMEGKLGRVLGEMI